MNAEKTTKPWSCRSPFVILTTQTEDIHAYDKARKNDMLEESVVYIASKIITNAKNIKHSYTVWRKKIAV